MPGARAAGTYSSRGRQPRADHALGRGKGAEMSENTESTAMQATEGEAQAQQPAAQAGGAAEARTFTQEEVNAIVEKRVARVKATPPSDYEELKAKAARLDELEEAKKSELEKANDATAKAKAQAEDWKARYEALEAENQRARDIAAKAAEYGVDADMLSRMEGDVDENARFLKAREEAKPKFGDMHDGGEQPPAEMTLEDIRAIKNPAERVRARAEYLATHKNG